ncbi:MAG: polyphosphate kinase 1 [Anaerolineaceae bacterium]
MPENTERLPINLDSHEYFLNRELSLLEFQRRVLEEAKDESNPLLERVKFLSILGSNLEEFFMVRVGGLMMQNEAHVAELPPDGMNPSRQLAEIRKVAQELMEESRTYWHKKLVPALGKEGIHILNYRQLSVRQKETADAYFKNVVFPVLTPLGVDPGHPFPHISNLSMNLAVVLRDQDNEQLFARVKVPPSLPQLVPIRRSSGSVRKDGTVPRHHYFVWLSQLIIANLPSLFPGVNVLEAHPFHVTRNADIQIQELEALDLLETMEESVRNRRFGAVVRMLVYKDMPGYVKHFLAENMKVDSKNIYTVDVPLNLHSIIELTRIDRRDLKDQPFVPAIPSALKTDPESPPDAIFTAIRSGNILLHHPYDSFSPVIDFLKTAARDPQVLAIKMTLYRVGNNSPVVRTLLEASRDYGKQVAVLVELKARFDEESNIGWAKMLEQEGVHVIYGLLGLKTHSKIAMVIRKEGNQIRRYLHLGTGNYNHITAQLYEDIGMFTCDDEIGADATDLFNYLTGYSNKKDYRKLLVAPINLREHFETLIRNEIDNQKKYGDGRIILKMNALVDKHIIQLLYQASQAGVKIELLVRGICCLRPGIKGISENIRVTSILGRFLEHSRIYYFYNHASEQILLGSADIMPRNLNQRVEVLFPVEDQKLIRFLHDEVLQTYLKDNVKTRLMLPDGTYKRLEPGKNEPRINAQNEFIHFISRPLIES